MGDETPLPAGSLSGWLGAMQASLRGEVDADVPCDGCTACCTSSQFVHIGPEETEALAAIPEELLFPAPRLPRGHVVLGYDEKGHCPMLVGGACSIYEHRPRTCRTYDCRIFPATGIVPDEDGKEAIAARALRWRFDVDGIDDAVTRDALQAAAQFVKRHRPARGATEKAVLAIEVYDAFVEVDEETGHRAVVEPDPHVLLGIGPWPSSL
ncbi:MAG TPA: YkgJ family cysteine cluster protein [Sporichthya sp.]|jgi:Fe-S-cluster containining protein|nr:YkgJ family cysteine cluster protein [Sporichthya sp.]